MKHFVYTFIAAATISFAACGSGNEKKPTAENVNPLWGMWIRQEPSASAKWEIMFNEDNTGFVFVADTLLCRTQWKCDSLLHVDFLPQNDSTVCAVSKRFEAAIDADTLLLRCMNVAEGEPAESRYMRYKQ